MKELLKRIIVALLGIPLLVFLIWQGQWFFFTLILIISIISQIEFYNLAKKKDIHAQYIPGILATIFILLSVQLGTNNLILSGLLVTLLAVFISEMFRIHKSALVNTSATFMGIIYPGVFLSALVFLRNNLENIDISSAPGFILTLFVSIWACDTFAYFIGKPLGKHRLFEKVSPKKSVEGALGGLFGALLIFIVVYYFSWYNISFSLAVYSGIIVGVFGQIGDLVESWFKRDAGIKDSSHILPGHGGFLDRFDSIIFVSPVFYILYLLSVDL